MVDASADTLMQSEKRSTYKDLKNGPYKIGPPRTCVRALLLLM